MLAPYKKKGRGPQAAKLEARPLAPRETPWLPPPVGRRPLAAWLPTQQRLRYLHARQSRRPQDQHATDAKARSQIQAQPMGGNPTGFYTPTRDSVSSFKRPSSSTGTLPPPWIPTAGRTPGSPVNSGSSLTDNMLNVYHESWKCHYCRFVHGV